MISLPRVNSQSTYTGAAYVMSRSRQSWGVSRLGQLSSSMQGEPTWMSVYLQADFSQDFDWQLPERT